MDFDSLIYIRSTSDIANTIMSEDRLYLLNVDSKEFNTMKYLFHRKRYWLYDLWNAENDNFKSLQSNVPLYLKLVTLFGILITRKKKKFAIKI